MNADTVKLTVRMVLLFFTLLTAGVAGAAETVNAVDLYLPSDPFHGVMWYADGADESILDIQETEYEHASELGMPGEDAIQRFHLSGRSSGTTSLHLTKTSSGTAPMPALTMNYRISVDDAGNVMIRSVEVFDTPAAPSGGIRSFILFDGNEYDSSRLYGFYKDDSGNYWKELGSGDTVPARTRLSEEVKSLLDVYNVFSWQADEAAWIPGDGFILEISFENGYIFSLSGEDRCPPDYLPMRYALEDLLMTY
ncbi:MAG: hypothetical protein IJ242_01175 [Clostridia bacterium]|nr:hypothetical protein [Clostridia bacterium]